MDLYGQTLPRNGSQSAHPMEWSPSGRTGLEESMMHMGLTSGESYPERPGVPVCVYYMRTGFCGYGSRCRYSHPRDRAMVAAAVRATGEYPERPGELVCQYYLKTGTCKFGASCKFHHPKHGGGSMSHVPLNIYGYPLRPGEKECAYYLQTAQCKFGITCKFHHPQPAGTSVSASAPHFYPSVQSPSVHVPEQYGGPSTNLRMNRPPLIPGYMQGAYGSVLLSPGVVPIQGWNPYSAPVSPVQSPSAQPGVGAPSIYGVTQLSSSMPAFTGPYPSLASSAAASGGSQKEQVFPERPGEPECQYYMQTGDCKFGASCRYHHPRERVAERINCVLSPVGLPLRPGVQPCTFYLQNGHCKFGSTCKFDHPMGTMRYGQSASSLTDAPVVPYPVGSFSGTMAPSLSSLELQPHLISGSPKDYSIRMTSVNAPSSTGLIFSQAGSMSLSDLQLSGQTGPSFSSSRSTRQGGEIRR